MDHGPVVLAFGSVLVVPAAPSRAGFGPALLTLFDAIAVAEGGNVLRLSAQQNILESRRRKHNKLFPATLGTRDGGQRLYLMDDAEDLR